MSVEINPDQSPKKISRREFLKVTARAAGLAVAAGLLARLQRGTAPLAPAPKPEVIFSQSIPGYGEFRELTKSQGKVAISADTISPEGNRVIYLQKAAEATTMVESNRKSETEIQDKEREIKDGFNRLRDKYHRPKIETRLDVLDFGAGLSSHTNAKREATQPDLGPTHAVPRHDAKEYIEPYVESPEAADSILNVVGLTDETVGRTSTQVEIASRVREKDRLPYTYAQSGGVTSIVAWFSESNSVDDIIAAWEASNPHLQAAIDSGKTRLGIEIEQAHIDKINPDGTITTTYTNLFAVTITLSDTKPGEWKPSQREVSTLPPTKTPTPTSTPTARPTLTPTKTPSPPPPPKPVLSRRAFLPGIAKNAPSSKDTFISPLPTPQRPVLRGNKSRGR